MVCTALLASWALSSSVLWLIPIACLLLYFAYGVYRRAQQMSELHLSTIEALALAIDAKDQTAHNHIRRVQIYAIGLARALGMPESEIQVSMVDYFDALTSERPYHQAMSVEGAMGLLQQESGKALDPRGADAGAGAGAEAAGALRNRAAIEIRMEDWAR